MTTVQKTIEHLQQNNKPTDHVAVVIWNVEDVLGRAKERKIQITQEQAEKIIDMIDAKHDANLGITWDTIDCWLDDLDELEE